MQTTLKDFLKMFPDDDSCLEHLFNQRYGKDHACKCGREPRWHRISKRPVYSCQWCGFHIHPMAGTLFEDSHTSLQSWFLAIYLFTTTRHGVSAKELQRQVGVTYKCAWRMGHQIRKHMDKVDGNGPLSGIVEIDECAFGGKQQGRHSLHEGKTLLLGMVERGGEAVVKLVPDARRETLYPVIEQNVLKGSELHTDKFAVYGRLPGSGYTHKTINHSRVYARNGIHVNTIEGYWSMLQRSIRGTHINVSGKHLERYAAEFSYRYNRRKAPETMLPGLLSSFQPLK